MDDLSDIVQQNRQARENEIPRAENIVEAHVGKFLSWQASVELVSLVDELRARVQEERNAFVKARMESMAHLSEPDRLRMESLMDELLEKLLLEPAQKLRGEKELAGKFRTWKHCATCFFPSGTNREDTANRHTRQPAGQMAGGIHSQEAICGGGVEAEIVIIKTAGDRMQPSAAYADRRKGNFHQGVGRGLLEESIDLAVHSVKDIPTDTPSRLMFPAVCGGTT